MSRYCEEAHRATRYKQGSKALRPGGCDDCGVNYCHCRIDPFETRGTGSVLPKPAIFSQGDPVGKTGGDYRFDGTVVSVLKKLSEEIRYVVEDDRGALHIYSARNLQARTLRPSVPECAPLVTALEAIIRADQVERHPIVEYDPAGSTYAIEEVDGPLARIARKAIAEHRNG